ncbi:Fur family transcriptional regulator [Thermodesulfatator atlanticus]|uniref:Fur family transcriptional regulator n=1 Tax=Thermodesulfatator atlanticus TaxID=501497 RepID=UPI0003B3EDD8|nr:transcriptional repressor [Thermodesulfatator atlanticus]
MEKLLEEFKKICQKNGIKVTPQRIAIYQELLKADDHPSAVVVYERIKKRFPNISLDTVNRTLLLFAELGLARIIEGHGDPKRFDPNTKPHHHFRCLKCGKIFDFYHEPYDELHVPEEISSRFKILYKRVNLEGFCENCRN